jgi:uncharacterized protein (TIGR00269 family)
MGSFEKNFRRAVGNHMMIESGDRIGVALSGGKDSSTVLYLLKKMIGGRRDISLVAISVDEGIEGSRDVALRKARLLCKKLKVRQHVYSFSGELGKSLDAKAKELGMKRGEICGFCGITRRWVLNKKARELGVKKLFLGINLDDEAESIMMNYIRGDMLRSSRLGPVTGSSMNIQGGSLFVPRCKPLRWTLESEVELYAKLAGIPFMPKGCKYRGGTRIETESFIQTMEKKHPGTMFSIIGSFDRILPCLEKSLAKSGKVLACKKCGEPCSGQVCKCCELWRS